MRLSCLVLLCSALACAAGQITELDKHNFDSTVLKSADVWVVEYMSGRCAPPLCQRAIGSLGCTCSLPCRCCTTSHASCTAAAASSTRVLARAGGTCKEFSPLYARVVDELPGVRFGKVNIDETAGMKLAVETGAIEDGIPNVRAYMREGDHRGMLVWAGQDAPSFSELRTALLTTVPKDANVKLAKPDL